MTRQATPAEVRRALKAEGYEVQITRAATTHHAGIVNVRRCHDRYPGTDRRRAWLLHGHMNDYRVSADGEVILP